MLKQIPSRRARCCVMRIALISLAAIVAPLEAQQMPRGPDVMRDTVFENGLHVIAVRNPSAPYATAILTFRAGAFTQADETQAGIPHLIEHMLFRSFQRTAGRSFGAAASELEAAYNGSTGEEMVNYYLMLPAKNVAKGVRVLADLVRNPRFDARELAPEVQVVRNELERNTSNPSYLLHFMVSQELWGDDWLKKNPGGNVLALQRATVPMLEALQRQYYTPNNAAVVVSGDIVISEVFAAAKQAFGGLRRGSAAALPQISIQPLKESKTVSVPADVADVTIQVAWHGPSAQSDPTGAMAADLLAAMVNNPNSEIQRSLVDEGLFQSVRMDYRILNHVGPITLTARTTADRLVAGSAALQLELAKLADVRSFDEEDLQLAKKAWRVDAALEWERGTSLAHAISYHWTVAGLESYLAYADGIAQRTVGDLQSCVERYITGQHRVVGILHSNDARRVVTDWSRMISSWGGNR